jgi:hypothetical protein
MSVRLLLPVAFAALIVTAGCHNSRDKAPIPDDPPPTSPLDRTDTTTVHVPTPPATHPN